MDRRPETGASVEVSAQQPTSGVPCALRKVPGRRIQFVAGGDGAYGSFRVRLAELPSQQPRDALAEIPTPLTLRRRSPPCLTCTRLSSSLADTGRRPDGIPRFQALMLPGCATTPWVHSAMGFRRAPGRPVVSDQAARSWQGEEPGESLAEDAVHAARGESEPSISSDARLPGRHVRFAIRRGARCCG